MVDSKTVTLRSAVNENDSADTDHIVDVDGPAELDVQESGDTLHEGDVNPSAASTSSPRRRSISIGIRSLIVALAILLLTGASATFAWLYFDARHQLDAQATQSANDARAEKISLDYAVNAATMDFKDLQAWKVKLVAGTSQELNGKLTEAGQSMEQILVPLEWSSTAQPLVAKVRSSANGVFVVDCFVSVQTKTVQAPQALQSTATYGVTIDSTKDWQITDVGGIGSVVGTG